MALQTRSSPDGRRKTTALLARLTVAALALACGSSATPQTPPAADKEASPPPPTPHRDGEVTLQIDDAGTATSFSFVLIPGKHKLLSVEEVWAVARNERGARLKLGFDTVVTFDRVDEGPYTACAVAKADRDRALGYDCKLVESATVTLAPAL